MRVTPGASANDTPPRFPALTVLSTSATQAKKRPDCITKARKSAKKDRPVDRRAARAGRSGTAPARVHKNRSFLRAGGAGVQLRAPGRNQHPLAGSGPLNAPPARQATRHAPAACRSDLGGVTQRRPL